MTMSILSGVTSEIIQQYLEENEQLIMAILQNRNIGKEAECAGLEARLQRNLTYLATVADCQDEMQATNQPPPAAATQLAPPPQFRMPSERAPPPRFRMPSQQTQQQMIPQSIRIPPSTLLRAPRQQTNHREMPANKPSNIPLGGGQGHKSGSSRDRAKRVP